MDTFLILRRSAWETEEELQADTDLAGRLAEDEMSDQVRWLRSYILHEEDGTLGTVCIYQAEDEDAIMEHSQRAEIPADEVMPVADTMIIGDDY